MDAQKGHPRGTPFALAIVVAGLALGIVFFAKVMAHLVITVLEQPPVSSALHRAARALGLAP